MTEEFDLRISRCNDCVAYGEEQVGQFLYERVCWMGMSGFGTVDGCQMFRRKEDVMHNIEQCETTVGSDSINMNDYVNTGTTTTYTPTVTAASSCPYMLQCGYCTKLDKPCPMRTFSPYPTWVYNPGPMCINTCEVNNSV